jgi:hypothetical protein
VPWRVIAHDCEGVGDPSHMPSLHRNDSFSQEFFYPEASCAGPLFSTQSCRSAALRAGRWG